MTVGEYIRKNHACPYCGSTDYHVFDNAIIDIYKCMACHRKMWETEALFIQEEPISEETITNDVCCENQLMVTNAKNGEEDLKKADVYLQKAKELEDSINKGGY